MLSSDYIAVISIKFQCGEKTNTYRRGCERCRHLSNVNCRKCLRRGHLDRDCPDIWRAYHNTVSNIKETFVKYACIKVRVGLSVRVRLLTENIDILPVVKSNFPLLL